VPDPSAIGAAGRKCLGCAGTGKAVVAVADLGDNFPPISCLWEAGCVNLRQWQIARRVHRIHAENDAAAVLVYGEQGLDATEPEGLPTIGDLDIRVEDSSGRRQRGSRPKQRRKSGSEKSDA